MKRVLVAIILEEHSTFVLSRLISDNIIVAFEAMYSLQQKMGSKVRFMALKLNMSKAYDRVEWPFLVAVLMRGMRFNNLWFNMICDCF